MLGQQPVLLPDALIFCLLGLPLAFCDPSSIVLAQVPHEGTMRYGSVGFLTATGVASSADGACRRRREEACRD